MLIVRSWPSDLPLPAGTSSIVAHAGDYLILTTNDFPRRRHQMANLTSVVTGGFAKGYRTQVLGVVTALSAVASWAVGDMSLASLIASAPAILGGLGLATLGAKVNNAAAAQPAQPTAASKATKAK